MATLTEKCKSTLEAAWAQVESNPMQYMQVVATLFIDFVGFGEKAFRNIFDRLKVVEAALNIALPVASTGKPTNGNSMRGMVRLDASGDVMSPADQAAAEQADMTFDGAIDMTRYVPAGSVPTAQPMPPSQPQAMPAPTPPTPAPMSQAVPPATMVSVPKSASMKQ